MWPPYPATPKSPSPPAPDVGDLPVYVYSAASPGKCSECNIGYGLNEVVVSVGPPESNRRTVHINCYGEAA
jgi:hypothetical protein